MIPEPNHSPSEKAVREIKRRTRRKFSTEEKIRIVLEGCLCLSAQSDEPPVMFFKVSRSLSGVKSAYLSCADVRISIPISTATGLKSSWKRGRNACLGILFAKRTVAKSKLLDVRMNS